jgi:tungstate transport system substrate-binding protein
MQQASTQTILKLATTTSTYETGLLDTILPPFEEEYNLNVHILSVGSGKALKMGEDGDVDVVLVHSPFDEQLFINRGFGVNHRSVMWNDFIIAGPKEDPAGIKTATNPSDAFSQIYKTKSTFISRGDNSGTHQKERNLWENVNISIDGSKEKWYLESGLGQAATLRIADEKNAYVLSDRASFLTNKTIVNIEILFEGNSAMYNPYSIIAVSPYKHKHVKYKEAMALVSWLTSPACQNLIARFTYKNKPLFQPNAAHIETGNNLK